jgi:5-oxoprolinase (ATP-hydrolysing)
MQPGDVYVLNDPYHGGTHLPDITVITPVYLDGEAARSYVGSRGHHADIGGITPGSMPPFSTRIEEEGVQIDNFKLVERGVLREAEMMALLAAVPGATQQNLADLKAQIAANEKGAQELRKMVAQFGLPVVQAYMRHVQDNAEESVRRAITRLKDGRFTLPLDNGAQIQVASASTAARSARIDFRHQRSRPTTSTRPAVCMAAVLYVFRTWSTTTFRSTPAA